MSFKKDVERLRQWAGGATKKLEPSSRVVPLAAEAPVNRAIEDGCAGKEAYPSKKAADAAQLYREQQGVPGQGMVAYCCRYCCSWHIGHSKPRPAGNPTQVADI